MYTLHIVLYHISTIAKFHSRITAPFCSWIWLCNLLRKKEKMWRIIFHFTRKCFFINILFFPLSSYFIGKNLRKQDMWLITQTLKLWIMYWVSELIACMFWEGITVTLALIVIVTSFSYQTSFKLLPTYT